MLDPTAADSFLPAAKIFEQQIPKNQESTCSAPSDQFQQWTTLEMIQYDIIVPGSGWSQHNLAHSGEGPSVFRL